MRSRQSKNCESRPEKRLNEQHNAKIVTKHKRKKKTIVQTRHKVVCYFYIIVLEDATSEEHHKYTVKKEWNNKNVWP